MHTKSTYPINVFLNALYISVLALLGMRFYPYVQRLVTRITRQIVSSRGGDFTPLVYQQTVELTIQIATILTLVLGMFIVLRKRVQLPFRFVFSDLVKVGAISFLVGFIARAFLHLSLVF